MTSRIALAAVVGVFVCVMPVCADTIFVEAESFKDWGGWVNDTQFMDQMGSPYLLAHDMGARMRPVARDNDHRMVIKRATDCSRTSSETQET